MGSCSFPCLDRRVRAVPVRDQRGVGDPGQGRAGLLELPPDGLHARLSGLLTSVSVMERASTRSLRLLLACVGPSQRPPPGDSIRARPAASRQRAGDRGCLLRVVKRPTCLRIHRRKAVTELPLPRSGRPSPAASDPHQSVATSGANVCYVGTGGRRAADHHMTLYGEAWPHRFRTGRALIQCRVPGRRRVGTFEDRKLPILIGSEEPIPAIRVSTRREPWYRFETVPRSRS